MEKIRSKILSRIKEYDVLEKNAHDRANINTALMYTNMKIGLLEALEIISETEHEERPNQTEI